MPLAPVPPNELPLGVKLEPIERLPNAPLDADCACAEAAQASAIAKQSSGLCVEPGNRLIDRSLKPRRRGEGTVVGYPVYYNRCDRQKLPALEIRPYRGLSVMYRTQFLPGRIVLGLLLILASMPGAAWSQATPAPAAKTPRPELARLLPPETLVYVRVANAPEVRDEFWQTSSGRMAQDPQFKPLWDQMFAAVEKAFEPVRDKLGLTVAEFLQLPRGELGFAVVPVTGAPPAMLLMLEAPDDDRNVTTFLERSRALLTENQWIEESETVGDTVLHMFRRGTGKTERVIYVRRGNVLLIGNDVDAFKHLLGLWNGGDVNTLADQPAFVNLERLIGKAEGKPAHITWFVDPINLARAVNAGSPSAAVGMAMLPALGLDGLTALGGSFTFNRGQFEVVGQAYLLLDVPRAGVLELIALQPTETEPEPWAFEDVASYATFTWDAERTYHKLRSIVDSFVGEGTFRRQTVENVLRETDVDFEADVLPQLDGRASFLVWIEEPVRFESRSQLFGIHLKDGKKFAPVLKKLTDKLGDKLIVKGFAGTTYYQAAEPQVTTADVGPEDPAAPGPRRQRPPRPRPAFCLLDDCLLIGDGSSVLEKALATAAGDSGRLSSSLDYKLISSKAKRYAGEQGPGYFGFVRPDEELRYLHGLAMNDRVREQLAARGEKNNFLKDINQALADRPPPPLEVLQQYFAPGGTIIVDEPTGVRYLSFVLRRDGDKK